MIFKSTADLREFFNTTTEFNFSDFLPFLESSLEDNLYPWLSKTQYDDLNAAYNSYSLTPAQENILPYAQRALAFTAMYKYSFFGDKTIGVSGINVNTNDEGKMLAQWRMEDLRSFCLDESGAAIERLLKYLETNKTTYTLWADSSSYTVYKESFINNVDTFNTHFKIGSSRKTFLSIKGIMKRTELFKIRPILGTALFDQIKSQIISGSISSNNQNLLEYIIPAVALLTGAEACLELPFTISEDGLVINSTSSSMTQNVKSSPQANIIEARMKMAEANGKAFLSILSTYLYDNHSTYPLYESDSKAYVTNPITDVNTSDSSTFIF